MTPFLTVADVRAHLDIDLDVWKYKPPLDIENNGIPLNVAVWQGFGLYKAERCGGGLVRNMQRVYILTTDGKELDPLRTASIFGRGQAWQPDGSVFENIALGDSYSPFKYRGIIYFDAFFSALGDLHGRGADSDWIHDILGVFVRRHGKTTQMCEYKMARQTR
jgi:hypothetical protein